MVVMNGPLIAIVGSAHATRESQEQYRPRMADVEAANKAAQALGRALASKGLRLLVYSCDPQFIEAAVVAAFLAERPEGRGLVQGCGYFATTPNDRPNKDLRGQGVVLSGGKGGDMVISRGFEPLAAAGI